MFAFTEASKVVMQYVAAVCGKGKDVDLVKEQLLQSNPVLEGNWLCPVTECYSLAFNFDIVRAFVMLDELYTVI